MKKKHIVKEIYIYTAFFLLIISLIFVSFLLNGKTMINEGDGHNQHFKALFYYARWLKEIFRNLLEKGKLHIPTYSFSLGYGSDIIQTLGYYSIGDPLNLLSVFVPQSKIHYFFQFLCIFRMYLAGISFLLFYTYSNESKYSSSIAGALSYVFCGYALHAVVTHPYFINPMIYFPLILLGIEKIRCENKKCIFIVAIGTAVMSNFYFLYMLVLLCGIYVVITGVRYKKDVRKGIIFFFRLIEYGIVGIFIGSITLLPQVIFFLQDNRQGLERSNQILYNLNYYRKLIPYFVSIDTPGYWTYMGYSIIAVLAIFMLFHNKGNSIVKIFFTIMTSIIILYMGGKVMNGFSYASNRWLWGYSMLISYILAEQWESLLQIKREEAFYLLIGLIGYFLYSMLIAGISNKSVLFPFVVGFMVISVLTLKCNGTSNNLSIIMLILLSFNIIGNAHFKYSVNEGNLISNMMDSKNFLENEMVGQDEAIGEMGDDLFYRFTGTAVKQNSTTLNGLSNLNYYWSLSNSNISNYMDRLGVLSTSSYNYRNLDDRTIITTLAGVKYFVTNNGEQARVPYGYQEIPIINKKYKVYKNQHILPLGYTYSGYQTEEEYSKLDSVAAEESMIQACVMEEEVEGYRQIEPVLLTKEIEYVVTCDNNVSLRENQFVVTKKNASISLTFEGIPDSETYLEINGLLFEGTDELALYSNDTTIDPDNKYTSENWEKLSVYEQNIKKQNALYYTEPTECIIKVKAVTEDGISTTRNITYKTIMDAYASGRKNFCVNLNYSNEFKNTITITFPYVGKYTFSELKVMCLPFKNYEKQIDILTDEFLENVDMHLVKLSNTTNYITGQIVVEDSKILCISIPYSDGWKAYVDGEEKEVYKTNGMYMGLALEPGAHDIELIYETPGLKIGMFLTILGILILIVIVIKEKSVR